MRIWQAAEQDGGYQSRQPNDRLFESDDQKVLSNRRVNAQMAKKARLCVVSWHSWVIFHVVIATPIDFQ
tara:strand:+ start:604 stop:810 length:207 start_codon:yes stop_codon:yes gene_type:complete